MKNILFIGAILVVLYFLMRPKAPAAIAPTRPRYVATGYQGEIDIVSIAASQPIIPTNNFLNFSEYAD